MSGEVGKGSKRRPAQIPDKNVQENWDRIFGPKKSTKDTDGRTRGKDSEG